MWHNLVVPRQHPPAEQGPRDSRIGEHQVQLEAVDRADATLAALDVRVRPDLGPSEKHAARVSPPPVCLR